MEAAGRLPTRVDEGLPRGYHSILPARVISDAARKRELDHHRVHPVGGVVAGGDDQMDVEVAALLDLSGLGVPPPRVVHPTCLDQTRLPFVGGRLGAGVT